ncbi:MAG: FkbM family methyltransferase [Candidatus Shapirobacteria bacterium]
MSSKYPRNINKNQDDEYLHNFNRSTKQIISYAQNGEDIVLNRAFFQNSSGFFIDIGAADPVINSVTHLFHQRGWKGINIEPNPVFFQKLNNVRKDDINLNIGIGQKPKTSIFYNCLTVKEWSTFSHQLYLKHKSHGVKFKNIKVKIDTLENILDHLTLPKVIDFLKVDVEGLEEQVLKSNNWLKYRPKVIIIETNHPQKCHLLMSRNNYLKVLDDGLNLFYLDIKYKSLKKYLDKPANVCDNFILYQYHQQFLEFQKKEKQLHQTFSDQYHQLSLEFQKKEKQLHQTFSGQYSLIENELKKTQKEFHILSQAHSELISKNPLPIPIISTPLINEEVKNKK